MIALIAVIVFIAVFFAAMNTNGTMQRWCVIASLIASPIAFICITKQILEHV